MNCEKKVIDLSCKVIRSFYNRKVHEILPLLDEDFLWMGSYSFQLSQGPEAFLRVTQGESSELPVTLTNESYRPLLHTGGVWVICGQYAATGRLDNDYICQELVRITLVWRETDKGLSLALIHGSNVQDHNITDSPASGDSPFFQFVRQQKEARSVPSFTIPATDMELRDETGQIHSLSPEDILYIQAANQWCHIFTAFDSFLTFGSLSSFQARLPGFLRIHRSYLMNPKAAKKLRYGKIILWNQTQLPVSKGRYKDVKAALEL